MNNKIILSILLLIVTFSSNTHSQELPVFGITGVNSDEFPLVKSYFNAKNGYLNDSYYKGTQNIPNPPAFDLTENGVSKDATSLTLKCEEIAGELPIHIALVVDASSSMFNPWQNGETRADVLKRAVSEFIDSVKFKNGTSIHIVPFAGNKIDANVWKDWNTTNPEAKIDFDFYRELVGRTDFNTPIFKEPSGRNVLEIFKSRPINDRKAVVFLTDGAHDNTNGNNPFETDFIIEELQKRGIEFHAITFAPDDFESVNDLRLITQSTGGVFYNANSEEELRDIYREITDSFKSTSVCWLEWLSQLECVEATERNVEVTFTRQSYEPITRNFTYTPPADKAIASITRDEDILYYDNSGVKSHTVTLTAEVGDFHVTGYNITNDNLDFSIPEFAAIPPAGFLIEEGNTRTFTVNYIKDPSDNPVDFQLVFETDLCPVEPIQLVAPCGPTTDNIDFGKVNLAGSTDYLAVDVFTNSSTGELTGTLALTGTYKDEFSIKSVNGAAGPDFTLAAGESMDVELTFTPTSTGNKIATLDYGITTDCGVATSPITADVIEADLALAPHNWDLVRIGNPVVYNYTIENTNDDPVEIETISLSDDSKGFVLGDVSGSLGSIDAKVGTTSFDITFTPNTEDPNNVDLQVKLKNRAEILTARLSGTGFVPEINGNIVNFLGTEVNTPATPIDFVISNISDYGKMVVNQVYLKNGSDASISLDLSGYTIGTEISKGETITIPVNFNPTIVGNVSGIIVVEADNVEGEEPVTFVLNEFNVLGVGLAGDEINLPLTNVGPILSCETTTFDVELENNTPSDVTVIGTLAQTGTDFNLISTNITIPANSTSTASIEYNPSGVGTHLATARFTFSDGVIYNAPIEGEANNQNADIIEFSESIYQTPVGTILESDFDINLGDFGIRDDIEVNKLTLSFNYNGRMLSVDSDNIRTNFTITPTVDVIDQVDNGNTTLIFNGIIPLDRDLNFQVPFLTLLGNDTLTTISVTASLDGLSCLNIETGEVTSITTGCNLGSTLITNLNIVDQGFAFRLSGENPVSDKLDIKYELPYDNDVTIEIYNSYGELITMAKEGTSSYGINDESIDVSNLPTGTYLIRFKSGPFVKSDRFVKIK